VGSNAHQQAGTTTVKAAIAHQSAGQGALRSDQGGQYFKHVSTAVPMQHTCRLRMREAHR
jgi:hypothetical protein